MMVRLISQTLWENFFEYRLNCPFVPHPHWSLWKSVTDMFSYPTVPTLSFVSTSYMTDEDVGSVTFCVGLTGKT